MFFACDCAPMRDVRGVFPQERASSPDFSRALSVTNPYARHRMVSCHGPDGVPISQTLQSVEAKMTHTTENKPPKRSFFQKIFAGSFFFAAALFFNHCACICSFGRNPVDLASHRKLGFLGFVRRKCELVCAFMRGAPSYYQIHSSFATQRRS